jgi:hypothetical protein
MKTKEEVLKNCRVEGLIVKLPDVQLERKLYKEVANALELIGGKWKGGKVFGFLFQTDPTELLEEISNGERRNLKKEFQFFATPDSIADWIVGFSDLKDSDVILEPSSGQGAIINAIHRVLPNKNVNWCELMPINQSFCRKIPNTTFVCSDMFEHNIKNFYDKIIANPPFSKNQDIDHVYKMYELLKPGGKLVSIVSTHWRLSNNKKETEFKTWLNNVGAEIHEIEAGAFKESGTMISSLVVIITKT